MAVVRLLLQLVFVLAAVDASFSVKPKIMVATHKTVDVDHLFVARVLIGTGNAAKPFRMLFDTVSSDIVVMGTSNSKGQKRHATIDEESKIQKCKYNSTGSETYYNKSMRKGKLVGDSVYRVSYSDGSSYFGFWAQDTVQIGRAVLEDVKFTVVDRALDSTTICLRGSGYDGVIGMNLETAARTSGGTSAFAELQKVKKSMKKAPTFSFHIEPDATTGEVYFGGTDDTDMYTGKMMFFRIERKDEHGAKVADWRLQFDGGMRIGTDVVLAPRFVARFESLAKFGIYVPSGSGVLEAIVEQVPGTEMVDSGTVVIECNKRKKLPDLELVIQNKKLRFTGEEYFPYRSQGSKKKMGALCSTFIVERDPEDTASFYSLGIPFFKKYYTSFSASGVIGMALSSRTSPYKKRKTYY